ncbi:MAG TPA: sodium:solute symporter family protein [Thermoanaerobaculia bacterium]|nr:sodium:solute symporter family protein [Thermoanaerobaculia bacterium]
MTLQLTVFLSYLVLVFALGAFAMRLTRDEDDYWIAGGRLGWLLGGATLAATHASAGTFIGTIGVIYTVGWSFSWLVLSIPIAYWFTAAVLAPRFTRTRQLTLPAFLESRYDSRGVRVLGAAIILIATVVYIQAQVVAGGLIANVVLGVEPLTGMVAFTLILIVYTVVGGMIAVVYTDLLQLVVMVLGAALAVPLAIHDAGGAGSLLAWVQATRPMAFRWDAMPGTLLFTMGLAFTLGSVATPEKLIRLYAMKDLTTIRRGVLLAIVVTTVMNLMVFVLALCAIVLFPSLATGDLAMPMVARAVLPPLLGALLLAAVTAAMMSTVDSLLIVAGSALAHDIVGTLAPRFVARHSHVWIARCGVVATGLVPLGLLASGVGEGELVQFIVLLFTALMASSFFAPVVLGVLWKRATRQGAMSAMVLGVSSAFAWELWGSEAVDPVLPGFVVSMTAMVTVSLLTDPPPQSALAPYWPADSGGD